LVFGFKKFRHEFIFKNAIDPFSDCIFSWVTVFGYTDFDLMFLLFVLLLMISYLMTKVHRSG